MYLLDEFRHPTRWYSKLVAAALALAFFTILAAGITACFVVYRVVSPVGSSDAIDLDNFPGRPQDVSFSVPGLGAREGWFFPGLKSAPTILLCPGYRDSRGELLPLATALQDHQYNVFLFDFDARGKSAVQTTLGFREVQSLRAAISMLAQREDVDRSRFGLWGTNLGAYTALALAESDPRVRAVAVESVYDRPQDMLNLLVDRVGLAPLPLLRRLAEKGFLWLNYPYRETPPLSAHVSRLAGIPKLFLEAADDPSLSLSTHELFVVSPEPRQEVLLTRGNYAGMLDEEKRSYENRIISFFLLNLAP